jgi:hypothetical protein
VSHICGSWSEPVQRFRCSVPHICGSWSKPVQRFRCSVPHICGSWSEPVQRFRCSVPHICGSWSEAVQRFRCSFCATHLWELVRTSPAVQVFCATHLWELVRTSPAVQVFILCHTFMGVGQNQSSGSGVHSVSHLWELVRTSPAVLWLCDDTLRLCVCVGNYLESVRFAEEVLWPVYAFHFSLQLFCGSRESAVGIATGCGLDERAD